MDKLWPKQEGLKPTEIAATGAAASSVIAPASAAWELDTIIHKGFLLQLLFSAHLIQDAYIST